MAEKISRLERDGGKLGFLIDVAQRTMGDII